MLFAGQSYYHGWYLSRELRRLGWKADVLDFDHNPKDTELYHGHDFQLPGGGREVLRAHLDFLENALDTYDIFHFSNAHTLAFGNAAARALRPRLPPGGRHRAPARARQEDRLLQQRLPRRRCAVVVRELGCRARLLGVPVPGRAGVCSDERNLAWGEFRNRMADLQVTTGGNRADFNNDPRVHEIPEFYCLDPELWDPDLSCRRTTASPIPDSTIKLYHSIGNLDCAAGRAGGT